MIKCFLLISIVWRFVQKEKRSLPVDICTYRSVAYFKSTEKRRIEGEYVPYLCFPTLLSSPSIFSLYKKKIDLKIRLPVRKHQRKRVFFFKILNLSLSRIFDTITQVFFVEYLAHSKLWQSLTVVKAMRANTVVFIVRKSSHLEITRLLIVFIHDVGCTGKKIALPFYV